eukprot:UN02371
MATSIGDGAYVKEHVHKGKKKKWYTYSISSIILLVFFHKTLDLSFPISENNFLPPQPFISKWT